MNFPQEGLSLLLNILGTMEHYCRLSSYESVQKGWYNGLVRGERRLAYDRGGPVMTLSSRQSPGPGCWPPHTTPTDKLLLMSRYGTEN